MSDDKTLIIERDGDGVVHVALNRPDKKNALSSAMIRELHELAIGVGASPDTRAMVLSGRGDVFCAGGDLAWMRAQIDADRAGRMAEARKLAEMLRALNEMPTPLIARVHGGAYGGGVGLACVCDVVLATPEARFGLTETRLGLIPATIGPYLIARMGEGRARQVFMSSRLFQAEEAVRLGIVSRVVAADQMDAAVAGEVRPYLNVSGEAVGRAKALARSLGVRIDDAVLDDTIRQLVDAWETDDAREGIGAFLEKRPARWSRSGR